MTTPVFAAYVGLFILLTIILVCVFDDDGPRYP
jgi:drug/metabolite transporter superfamily protein YnfA